MIILIAFMIQDAQVLQIIIYFFKYFCIIALIVLICANSVSFQFPAGMCSFCFRMKYIFKVCVEIGPR